MSPEHLDLVLPGIARTSVLAVPERLVDSAWLGHVPFAFWLVDAHRPGRTVELGVHNGASLCAMIQGAKAVGHHGYFNGVDHWIGDDHAGAHDADVYWNLMAFHEARHRDMSSLMCIPFDEALCHFPDGSVDLLHIDGLHTYEAVRHDFDSWLPKMGPRGVVIFHDTCERREGFGVWRLWSEVSARYPSFNISHSHGLGVLYVGSDPVPEWMSILARVDTSPEGDAIRTWFNHLGDAVALRREMARLQEHAQRLAHESEAQRGRADVLERRAAAAERAIGCANQVVASQATRLAERDTAVGSAHAMASELAAELDRERQAHARTRESLESAMIEADGKFPDLKVA